MSDICKQWHWVLQLPPFWDRTTKLYLLSNPATLGPTKATKNNWTIVWQLGLQMAFPTNSPDHLLHPVSSWLLPWTWFKHWWDWLHDKWLYHWKDEWQVQLPVDGTCSTCQIKYKPHWHKPLLTSLLVNFLSTS